MSSKRRRAQQPKRGMSNVQQSRTVARLAIQKSEIYSGPLPHPDIMEKYESILPGAADRIINMAEKQSDHRMSCEKYFLSASMRQSNLGQFIAAVITLSGVLGGVYLLANNKSIAGYTTFVGSLGTLAGIFIATKEKSKKEVSDKKTDDDRE